MIWCEYSCVLYIFPLDLPLWEPSCSWGDVLHVCLHAGRKEWQRRRWHSYRRSDERALESYGVLPVCRAVRQVHERLQGDLLFCSSWMNLWSKNDGWDEMLLGCIYSIHVHSMLFQHGICSATRQSFLSESYLQDEPIYMQLVQFKCAWCATILMRPAAKAISEILGRLAMSAVVRSKENLGYFGIEWYKWRWIDSWLWHILYHIVFSQRFSYFLFCDCESYRQADTQPKRETDRRLACSAYIPTYIHISTWNIKRHVVYRCLFLKYTQREYNQTILYGVWTRLYIYNYIYILDNYLHQFPVFISLRSVA